MFLKSGLIYYYYLPSRRRSGCVFLEIPKNRWVVFSAVETTTLTEFLE
jgi:hypothetical protein